MNKRYQNLTDKVVRDGARLLLVGGAKSDVKRGIRCLRDLLLNVSRLRRKRIAEIVKYAEK